MKDKGEKRKGKSTNYFYTLIPFISSIILLSFHLYPFTFHHIFYICRRKKKIIMSALSNRINNLSESATIKMAKLGRELA
ncbi:MAG: hypothetical protein ACXVB6_17420, partial [Mucilaginibacter sp.]